METKQTILKVTALPAKWNLGADRERMLKLGAFVAAAVLGVALLAAGIWIAGARSEPEVVVPEGGPPLVPLNGEADRTGYVKGLYVSYGALSDAGFMKHVKDLLESTELNAAVIDYKGDRGYLSFPSSVPLALELGVGGSPMIKDPEAFMRWFKERNVYTIARIVVFKDSVLSAAHPELAVIDSATGGVWRDGERLGWVDPSYHAVWDYNVALAVEAAKIGFDEVQFDYVRFPTDGQIGRATFTLPNTMENRVAAITGLLQRAQAALQPYNVKLSADVFGYAPWDENDLGIGQHIESIAPYLDVLCPMLYPSTFDAGLPGDGGKYRNAIAFPYEIINLTTERTIERAKAVNPGIEVRPWVQDFGDYAFDGRTYTPEEIRKQFDAALDAGGRGWLLWDPAVRYTREALRTANPSFPSNTQGGVLVLRYHRIGRGGGEHERTPEQLRGDLERLLATGYYPINLRDLGSRALHGIPAGKRPIVLTFDGSTPDQFRVGPDGALDPDSAVGILKLFHDQYYPNWPLHATFFVQAVDDETGSAFFGQPEWAASKLQLLADWGFEVGLQLGSEANLARGGPEKLAEELGKAQLALGELLPGYQAGSVNVASGRLPKDWAILAQNPGDGVSYGISASVAPREGISPSPLSEAFDPFTIPRVPAVDSVLYRWLPAADRQGVHYVSPGE